MSLCLKKGDHPHYHHAHILLTLRQTTAIGLRPVKTREWNSDALVDHWRALWPDHQNRGLASAGLAVRVNHRSLEAQRIDALQRGDRNAAAALSREPEIHIVRREPRQPSEPMERPRIHRNAAILSTNAHRAQQRIDMWRRAYVQRLRKPRKEPESQKVHVALRNGPSEPQLQRVCTENLNPTIMMMKSAKDGA